MSLRPVAVASRADVAQAARAVFPKGNAADAVVAGVFAAAAAHPAVLLGPVQILVGGPGAGPRAVDGRVRQPGLGAPRPRGFKEGEEIPPAARVGVPALPAALCTALASAGSLTLAQALAPALDRAKGPRALVLERIARRGASAIREAAIADPLIEAAGRVAGGVLTREDLEQVRPALVPCERRTAGALELAVCPWGARAVLDPEAQPVDAACTEIVAAGDVHGLTAIACFETHGEGTAVEALDLTAPWIAAPVRRGQTRVRPGEARASAAPLALVLRGSALEHALGVAGRQDAERALGSLLQRLGAGEILDPKGQGERVYGIARSRATLTAVERGDG
jgi:gamma-glutamyltranspeptidase/glutathione hydrolase